MMAAAASKSSSIHQDEDGNCVFGKKEYWDQMYGGGRGGETASGKRAIVKAADRKQLPSDAYSWYCGWDELEPFWRMIVPDRTSRILIAGIGNDPTPVGMFDAGWTTMLAYDYSQGGVDRARELFGADRGNSVELITADARNLPLETASVDSTLDKGTLDAIYITGEDIFLDSVKEMGRVTAAGGYVVSISRVIEPNFLLGAFDEQLWVNVHDGSLAFATDGEATIDLGAELFSWKRTAIPYHG